MCRCWLWLWQSLLSTAERRLKWTKPICGRRMALSLLCLLWSLYVVFYSQRLWRSLLPNPFIHQQRSILNGFLLSISLSRQIAVQCSLRCRDSMPTPEKKHGHSHARGTTIMRKIGKCPLRRLPPSLLFWVWRPVIRTYITIPEEFRLCLL